MNKKMNNKGFSLIELIIVIAIMAVLIAILAPNLTSWLGKSKVSTDRDNAKKIENVIDVALQGLASEELTLNASSMYEDGLISGIISAANSGTSLDPEGVFEDNIKDGLNKMLDSTGALKTPKQGSGYNFYYNITPSSTGTSYTVEVQCAKTNPFSS